MIGAKLVYPGPHLDPESLLDAFVQEGVTWTAGVPTIWMGILAAARRESRQVGPLAHEGHARRRLRGAARDDRRLQAAARPQRRARLGHDGDVARRVDGDAARATLAEADEETQFDYIAMQGMPLPFVELRVRDFDGNEVPWDGEAMGELEIRGPWVAAGYYDTPEQADRWTDDGWFKTGDIVSMHPQRLHHDQGPLEGRDQVRRRVDLVGRARERADGASRGRRGGRDRRSPTRSGRSGRSPCVVLREGATATADELREFLAPNFAKWWLPDRFEFVAEIPKTAVGKFRKTALREQFAQAPVATS